MEKMMKLTLTSAALSLGSVLFSYHANANDDQTLLNYFHEYGITKCDSFILQNSKLKDDWNLFVGKHAGGIDGPTTEITITRIYGQKGDTVKIDDTYLQTPNKCYLRSAWTVTFPGTCAENIDGNLWYISNPMPGNDYTTYKNAGGIELQAKEISVGNFKACIQEGSKRLSEKQGKI
jgi:hypothetical protein